MLSRTADSLYWLSRYVERAENTARIIDAAARSAALPQSYSAANEWEGALAATSALNAFHEHYDEITPQNVLEFLAFSPKNPSSIRSCLEIARFNARSVRTALTIEMWETINSAWLEMKNFSPDAADLSRISDFVRFVKQISMAFDGSGFRTMLRNDGYYFNRIGVYMERADATARLLDVKYHVLLPPGAEVGGSVDYFQWSSILRATSTLTAYHWVYRQNLKPWLVADLMIFNMEMPRSTASCYEGLTRNLDSLARAYGRQGASQRLARTTFSNLQNMTIDDAYKVGLHEFLTDFLAENNRLGQAIAEQYLV
jgi:uncharacterized alpha-E superfamily protein